MYVSDANHPSRNLRARLPEMAQGNWFAKGLRGLKDRAILAAERHKILSEFQELLGLPDSMLRDMGLTRDQVNEELARFRRTGITERPTRSGRM